MVFSNVTLIFSILHIKPHIFLPVPKQFTKNRTTKKQEENVQQTVYVHYKMLSHGQENLR